MRGTGCGRSMPDVETEGKGLLPPDPTTLLWTTGLGPWRGNGLVMMVGDRG